MNRHKKGSLRSALKELRETAGSWMTLTLYCLPLFIFLSLEMMEVSREKGHPYREQQSRFAASSGVLALAGMVFAVLFWVWEADTFAAFLLIWSVGAYLRAGFSFLRYFVRWDGEDHE
jgi:uncharacterized membrane protein